jgi:hypothetical protein
MEELTMAKPKSEFLKGAGKMWAIMQVIVNAVLEMGGSDEDLHRLLNDNSLVKQIAELIVSGKKAVAKTYNVMVDYSMSLADMIKAGKYDWSNDDITDKRFSFQGTGQHEVELVMVHLNRSATTREVRQYMDEQGLEPAKIEHLLAFGATYPEIQREFPIIALGSSFVPVHGDRIYPYLHCRGGGRMLSLRWNDDDRPWVESCRFLAVGK